MKIYLDNAATTQISKEVLDEMLPYLTEHYGNPSSIHSFGRKAKSAIEQSRKIVAKYLNASTAEIFFTGSGTEASNTIIKCAVRDLGVQRIISSRAEHHCVLHSIDTVEKLGIEIDYVKLDGLGRVDISHLEGLLDGGNQKTLVSLMHANNEIGTMINLNEISSLCKKYKALFHSDTVQTIGYYPFDLQAVPLDFMSGSAHKFHGPKGVGFMYVNGNLSIKPYIDGGSQERNMRAGTENVPGIVGLGKALELAIFEMETNKIYLSGLKSYMLEQLTAQLPDVKFNGDLSENGCNYKVLSVALPPTDKSELVLFNLDMAGIAASGGSACTSGSEKGSHVLETIQADVNRKSVRFSFSKYNTKVEIDNVISILKSVI
jgi:cysteine desulfurase